MDAVLHALARVVRVGARPRRAARRRTRGRRRACPRPAGPWKRYAWLGRPSGGSAAVRTARAWGCRSVPASTSGRSTTMRGRLITIEGLDGAGKTTLADALVPALAARGADVELLREPGGVELSERIRTLVQGPRAARSTRGPRRCSTRPPARSCAPSASRPLLDAGRWVLLDRFVDSSLAYQGAGRGLGVERGPGDQRLRHRRPRPGPDAAAARRHRHARCAPQRPRRGAGPPRARGRRVLRRDRRGVRRARRRRAGPLPGDRRARRARRGARGGARGGRGPPTIGGVTRRILAAVLLVAGLALPSVAAAQQTTSPAPRRPDHRSGGRAARRPTPPRAARRPTRPPGARRRPTAGRQTTPSATAPAATPPAATPTTAPAATPPPAATTATGTATQPAATSGNDRAAVIMLLLVTALLVLAARAVAGRPVAGLGPAVARPLASRHRRGRLARGERVGRVHRLDAARALSRRLSPSPARSRTPSSRRSPWRPCRRR